MISVHNDSQRAKSSVREPTVSTMRDTTLLVLTHEIHPNTSDILPYLP